MENASSHWEKCIHSLRIKSIFTNAGNTSDELSFLSESSLTYSDNHLSIFNKDLFIEINELTLTHNLLFPLEIIPRFVNDFLFEISHGTIKNSFFHSYFKEIEFTVDALVFNYLLKLLWEDGETDIHTILTFEEQLKNHTPLTIEKEMILSRMLREGDQSAKKFMIDANQHLVFFIAKKYIGHHLSLLELINEGNVGLSNALDKFDFSKGIKFSTYATWWVRNSIIRAVSDKSRLVRVPTYFSNGTLNHNKKNGG